MHSRLRTTSEPCSAHLLTVFDCFAHHIPRLARDNAVPPI
jgi:hypothetical protein